MPAFFLFKLKSETLSCNHNGYLSRTELTTSLLCREGEGEAWKLEKVVLRNEQIKECKGQGPRAKLRCMHVQQRRMDFVSL